MKILFDITKFELLFSSVVSDFADCVYALLFIHCLLLLGIYA
jgi:hypothetical protein